MKVEALKKILREVVREVIQDELKDILLEALKAPKTQPYTVPVTEHVAPFQQPIVSTPTNGTPVETTQTAATPPVDNKTAMEKYMSILNETANPPNAGTFTPNPGAALGQGSLGEGEVDMSQITALMKG